MRIKGKVVVEDNSEIASVRACINNRVPDPNCLKALSVFETRSYVQDLGLLVVKLKLVDDCPRFNVFDTFLHSVNGRVPVRWLKQEIELGVVGVHDMIDFVCFDHITKRSTAEGE